MRSLVVYAAMCAGYVIKKIIRNDISLPLLQHEPCTIKIILLFIFTSICESLLMC